ncbi:MAG: LptF/LptG family permease, partial [Chlamydiia bacterium]|nr:LptF/LptG family permease [Chlamydiia bacterium]
MPIVWRHLLSHYFKIFLTVLSVFVLLLLAIQLDEIAQFIVFSRDGWKIGRFFLQLIPYIIPIALPISSLLA